MFVDMRNISEIQNTYLTYYKHVETSQNTYIPFYLPLIISILNNKISKRIFQQERIIMDNEFFLDYDKHMKAKNVYYAQCKIWENEI